MGLVGLLMQKQNKTVGMKLLVASLAMFTLPITAYFLVFDWLGYSFHYAAAAAVVVTNFVIAGYVIMAFSEPEPEDPEDERVKSGKAAPRTGIFKNAPKTD